MYRFEKEISDRYLVQTPEAYNEYFTALSWIFKR